MILKNLSIKNLLLIILFFFTGFYKIHAQHIAGVKIYSGLTKMYMGPNDISGNIIIDIKKPIHILPNGGLYYNYNFDNNLLIGIEVSYTKMKYTEQKNITSLDSNFFFHLENSVNLNYIELPIYAGFKAGRFSADLGLVTLILLNDNWKSNGEIKTDGETVIINDNSKTKIDKFDIGFRVGFVFTIYKRLHFESHFMKGINNLFIQSTDETNGYYFHNQQLTIGLRYDIFK